MARTVADPVTVPPGSLSEAGPTDPPPLATGAGALPPPRRLVRAAGALGLAHVVLLFAGLAVQDTVLFSEGREGMETYRDGNMALSVLGLYVELLGFLLMLPVLVLLVRLVGRRTEGGRWAAQTGLAAGLGYLVLTFSPGVAAGVVSMHAMQNGVDVDTAWTLNNLRVVTYVASLMLLGVHALATGIAALSDGWGRWAVGWAGVATGAVLLTAPLLLQPNLHDLTTLVWLVWWAVLSVRLLRRK